MKTRIAIVEDDPKYRMGLATLLGAEPSFVVEDMFPAATPLVERLERPDAPLPWDLVIMDLGLPGLSGIDAIRRLKQRHAGLPIVAFTVFEEPATILDAICAGADGYLLERTPADELVTQLQAVVAGGSPLTPGVARIVLEVVRRHEADPSAREPERHLGLSGREREVLRLLAQGMVHKQVADQLGISLETVRTYVRRIYQKLQVKTVAQAPTTSLPWSLIYGPTSLILQKLDSDHDGWGDSLDCAPFDAGAFALPGEITGEAFAADKQTFSWDSAAPSSGSATVHDAMRGALNELPVGNGGAETCLASADSGFYYLVRGRDVCGAGTYGSATSGAQRTSSVCP